MRVSNYDDGRAYMRTWGGRVLSAHMRHRKDTRQQYQNHSTRHPHALVPVRLVLYSPPSPSIYRSAKQGVTGGNAVGAQAAAVWTGGGCEVGDSAGIAMVTCPGGGAGMSSLTTRSDGIELA